MSHCDTITYRKFALVSFAAKNECNNQNTAKEMEWAQVNEQITKTIKERRSIE